MVRVLLEPEVEALAVEEEDPGFIELPDIIFSYDIIEEALRNDEELAPMVKQYVEKYNFYYASCKITAGINRKAKGAKWILIKGKISDRDGKPIIVDDVGPKSNWLKKDAQLGVELKVDFDAVLKLFKLIDLPNIASGNANFKWTPKRLVAEILSGNAGSQVSWKFSAAEGKFVDGEHQIFFIMRVLKGIDKINFNLTNAEIEYDYSFARDKLFFKNPPLSIPIEIPS